MLSPFGPDFINNPYPYYRRLRRVDPVYLTPQGTWFLTRYEDVNRVLRDRTFLKQTAEGYLRVLGPRAYHLPVIAALSRMALYADPPAHTRLRAVIANAFGPRRHEDMRRRVQEITDRLIDTLMPIGRMEIVRDYAYPLSINVIGDLLGMPDEDRPPFLRNYRVNNNLLGALFERAEMVEASEQILLLESYFRGLVELRRRRPGNDLTSELARVAQNPDELAEDELIDGLVMLFIAGHETTANTIANGIWTLHRHPEEMARYRAQPEIAANAVDELMRFEPPVQYFSRIPQEDVEIGGKVIGARQLVYACVGAANRDPAIYPKPDQLDIGRPNIRPLAFSSGIHFCVGAQLARMEVEIAITSLLRRLPGLKIDDLERTRWRPVLAFRNLEELPASW